MNDDTPDLATVADALAGGLTADGQADLEALLATDPVARETFARHERALAATSRLLASHPAPALPVAVADSLDAALASAVAARRPGSTTTPPALPAPAPAREANPGHDRTRPGTGRQVRRYATNFALAAVVVGGLVLAVTQLHLPGSSSQSSAGSAAAASTAAGTAASSAAAGSAAAAPAGPTVAAGTPVPRLSGAAPTARPGAAAVPGGVALPTGDLSPAGLPTAARALAADRAATTAACPARPGTRTSLRPVRYAGAPAWLAVTPHGDTLLAEVTRTVCGGALLTRTVPAH